jgi:hypothetical protein
MAGLDWPAQAPAPVAQLDRASVYGTEGHRFESCRARFVSQRIMRICRAFVSSQRRCLSVARKLVSDSGRFSGALFGAPRPRDGNRPGAAREHVHVFCPGGVVVRTDPGRDVLGMEHFHGKGMPSLSLSASAAKRRNQAGLLRFQVSLLGSLIGRSQSVFWASLDPACSISPVWNSRRRWLAVDGREPAHAPREGNPPDTAHWEAAALTRRGSWWPDYMAWLEPRSGNPVPAPKKLGGRAYKAMARRPAPT